MSEGETRAERNRRLGRLRYSLDRERILREKRRYYRQHRAYIRAQQNTRRRPFVSTPARRAYMRAYMRQWRARP